MPRQKAIDIKSLEESLNRWLTRYDSLAQEAEAAPIRRDMVTLLTYVRDNEVIGTQSTGNMPLKAIREVTARFVYPPKLDSRIGDHTYHLRSETDVRSLFFLHVLADVGGLIKTGSARRWRITAQAKRYLETGSPAQAGYLLAVWWNRVNWLITFPFSGMGRALPDYFHEITLDSLLSLPIGEYVSFEDYADELIEDTGLTWSGQAPPHGLSSLRASIRRMVIDVLADFDAVNRRYREEPLGKGVITHLEAIEITLWGRALLDTIARIRG
jgi:hypothetical protein